MMSRDMRDLPELWVLRHGETVWNAAGRLQGRLDSPLTETGILQAKAQGRILAEITLPAETRLVSSPAGRALRTARIVGRAVGRDVTQDAALLEIDLGAWQGQYIKDIPEARAVATPDGDPHAWKFSGPGCESLDDMVARLHGFLAGLDGPTVIVTHGVTSRVLRCLATGQPPSALSRLPGGQGVVHHVEKGQARMIPPATDGDDAAAVRGQL